MTTARGYTTPEAIGAYVGVTLTSAQLIQVESLLPLAESYIDYETQSNGGWLNGPITSEQYDLFNTGDTIYLRSVPVLSVQQIIFQTYSVQSTPVTWVAGTDYRFVDPARGLIVLNRSFGGYPAYSGWAGPAFNDSTRQLGTGWSNSASYALVDYTPVQTVPPPISQAATMLVAHWIEYQIYPTRFAVSSYKTADASYTFPSSGGSGGSVRVVPQEIADILRDFTVPHF